MRAFDPRLMHLVGLLRGFGQGHTVLSGGVVLLLLLGGPCVVLLGRQIEQQHSIP
jgi:hypothetical protein